MVCWPSSSCDHRPRNQKLGGNEAAFGIMLPSACRLCHSLLMPESQVQLAFHDNFCDISFKALWEEVRQKQEVLSLTPVNWCAEHLDQ